MGDLFKPADQHTLISRCFLSDVKGAVDKLFAEFATDSSLLKAYLQYRGIPPVARSQHFCEFLAFKQIPSSLYLHNTLLETKAEAQKLLAKYKPDTVKALIGHIRDVLSSRIASGRAQFTTEEAKQITYSAWNVLRGYLPGIDSVLADNLLLMVFEQLSQSI